MQLRNTSLVQQNERMSALPPCGFLIGIYLLYENWSTKTFRERPKKVGGLCHQLIFGAG